mgnify:CR=1 FL=1|jgi:peptide/nickel transport system permease protein|tara:strand:- start:587 stop:1543 length:957 start_codon:yes stop_codon:yes gene_type:complete
MKSLFKSVLEVALARGLQAIIVAIIVGIVSFLMMQALPGDAAYRIAAGRYGYDLMDSAAAEAVRLELGLDNPWFFQLWSWLGQLAQFDLGNSLVYGTPVIDNIVIQLGYSLLLAGCAIATSLLIAIPVGIITGLRPNGLLDQSTLGLSIFLRAIPAFALGIVLVMVFAVQLKLFPVAGFRGFESFILPSFTLGIGLAAVSNRVVRDAVSDAMSSNWQLFARTKGLSMRATLICHVIRNASLPVVTYLGVQLAYLIEGVVIVETVFAWPGIGHALVHAIFGRDIAMVQGTALTLGLLYVALNLCVDLACRSIDQRGGGI